MIKLSVPFVVFVAKASIVVGLDQVSAKATVRALHLQEENVVRKEGKRALLASAHSQIASRLLQGEGETTKPTCDKAFAECLEDEKCVNCFLEMNAEDLDWASASPDSTCSDLLDIVFQAKHCTQIRTDTTVQQTFCKTFEACVLDVPDSDAGKGIDCNKLTECEWPGKHAQFIGDGTCHAHADGCYNTEVCEWDGGDCCPDTCSTNSTYVECGQDGYWCVDPKAKGCDSRLTSNCENAEPDMPDIPKCGSGTTAYRVVMYDSFGDGWDNTTLAIQEKSTKASVFEGSLKEGATGTEYICLKTSATCYHADATGGAWGNEVSWEIRPLTEGASSVAGGGSPQSCDFSIAGDSCKTTCDGAPDIKPTDDPGYRTFKEMYNCITEKCKVQLGQCQKDSTCTTCFKEDVQQFCYSDPNFNALADCSLCKCTDAKDEGFCEKKLAPSVIPSKPSEYGRPECSPQEKVKGSQALIEFTGCTKLDQISILLTNFDQNHFGGLDKFESCAHEFRDGSMSHTALGCMQLLVNTAANMTDSDKETPRAAVAAISNQLYLNPGTFCECASDASKQCPLCRDFLNVKTILYEAVDACSSLDEIDCPAWQEFYPRCKSNLLAAFDGRIDFKQDAQCKYLEQGCGGVGPFPAFRHLDCGNEIPYEEWNLYQQYSQGCQKSGGGGHIPAPPPISPPGPRPPPYPPVSPTDQRPYVPPEERQSAKGDKEQQASHWIRNLFVFGLVGCVLMLAWERRGEFELYNFRRARRNYGAGAAQENSLYNGLTLESSTRFEPPTLPPTPMQMGKSQEIGGDQFYS